MSARTLTSEQGGGCCPATERVGETDAKEKGGVRVDMKSNMVGSAKNIFWKKKPYVLGQRDTALPLIRKALLTITKM